jgi:Resolvase, N terminal domain
MVKDGCPDTLCKRWPTAPAFGDWHGFQRLIAEVGLGKAGLVMSLDASRLARNNRDWHQLLELCSLFGVLIADGERLYDPGAYHDRLLLGLSEIMSEAELHQIKVFSVPPGYRRSRPPARPKGQGSTGEAAAHIEADLRASA